MISIITPTYNRELLVQRTIKSIQAQSYTNWELIIIDDGSTDGTEQVIQNFLTDKRIRYYKKKNTGQAHSLNVGVSYARGEFIVFLDSDDEAYTNWLEEVHKRLKDNTGIVCVGAIIKRAGGTLIKDAPTDYTLFGQTNKVKYTCGSFFIRKNLFLAVNGYDTTLKANIQQDLCIRLLYFMKGTNYKVVSLDKFLVQINIHNQGRIRNNWGKVRDGGIQLLNKHYDLIYKNDPKTASKFCAIIAHSNFKLKDKKQALEYSMKAIRYNPWELKNYLRAVKYAIM